MSFLLVDHTSASIYCSMIGYCHDICLSVCLSVCDEVLLWLNDTSYRKSV